MQILLTEVLFLSVINQIHSAERQAAERKKSASAQADAMIAEAELSAERQSGQIVSLAKTKAAFVVEKARINAAEREKNVSSLAESDTVVLEKTCSVNMQKTVDKILSFITNQD